MMRRPPGSVASQRKLFLALALFLLNPALRLVEAQQQPQQQQNHLVRDHSDSPGLRQADDRRPLQPFAASVIDDVGAEDSDGRPPSLSGDKRRQKQHNPREASTHVSPAEVEPLLASRLTVENPNLQSKRTATGDSVQHPARSGPVFVDRDPRKRSKPLSTTASTSTTTVAPDLSVRAPSLAYRDSAAASGHALASPHSARSLADWEVEDFVLLATVDGDLYSVGRKTGKILWHNLSEKPVVETKHHRSNISALDESFSLLDHWIWAVEPSRNGAIYLMIPGSSGLAETGLTMKWLVEQVPYYDRNHPVVFTGTKESTMVTLDAATGRPLEWYGSNDADSMTGNSQDARESCLRPTDFGDSGGAACPAGGTITLGRTDYKVVVRRNDGLTIATLKYSEWGPNNYDKDLHQQHEAPSDNRYISGKPNGEVYGFSFDPSIDSVKLSFSHRLDAPIVRVFDIARPPGVPSSSNPDLAVLPQPPPPAEDDETVHLRKTSVFMNETVGGSWYALSGTSYPLIIDVPAAECTESGWWDTHHATEPSEMRDALAGKHSLVPTTRNQRLLGAQPRSYPALPGRDAPSAVSEEDGDNGSTAPLTLPDSSEPSPLITKVKELPQVAANSVLDFLSNPVFMVILATFLFLYQKDLRRWYGKKKFQYLENGISHGSTSKPDVEEAAETPNSVSEGEILDSESAGSRVKPKGPIESGMNNPRDFDKADIDLVPDSITEFEFDDDAGDATPAAPSRLTDTVPAPNQIPPPTDNDGAAPEKEKKKAHRGRRGGAKHRKGNKAKPDASVSRGDDPPRATVDEVVDQAKELGEKPNNIEPDIVTVPSNVQEVSGPILRMGSLEVNEDQQLGTGSNGTVVFAGKFDGRDVAVKRMLVQFYDIASQETKLLRESDDHPNVIRYYAQQQRAAFHYIALELCQASLAEVIEKPQMFRSLAQAGERDLPNVLYQITSGLNHLHSRNIVHRDLKPQNILVNMGADDRPRLLISDFGLCKKLEGGQSSFGATTAHAAGTSGWRAPELLLDDDARDTGTTMVEAAMSTQSGSHASFGEGRDGLPNRRATKAIDIFSLGLVFFYVLTKGSHPFDCGDRYMREVNIRKDNYNLDGLDALGDFAYEAKNLIQHMLDANPRQRPKTKDIRSHPFFWPAKRRLAFLCDVSDHFEKEPRDPPSPSLERLENKANEVCRGDFLRRLPKEFVESLGKQRKYTGSRLLDLLRALRNKRNHYEDMPEALKKIVGPLPEGYLGFWTRRFPNLLIECWTLGLEEGWEASDRFAEYYEPAGGL